MYGEWTRLDSKDKHILNSSMCISGKSKIISNRKPISSWTRAHGYERDNLKSSRPKLLEKRKCSVSWMGWWLHVYMHSSKLSNCTFSMVLVCCAEIMSFKADLKLAVSGVPGWHSR